MAQINNSASATYGYGRDRQDSAISNVATANLIEQYALSGSKIVQNTYFRPGEILSYYISTTNTGTDPLYNLSINDALGDNDTILSYVDGSAYLTLNGVISQIIPSSTNPLTFNIPTTFEPGDIATVNFLVRVNSSISPDITEITNTATISATPTPENENPISATASTTINREEYAEVTITKSVSTQNITEGVPFTYTLELENSGNLPAYNVVVTDVLPENFEVLSITSTTNGVSTTYTADDYTVDPTTNTLTLPTNPAVEITVPASDNGGVGLTTIVITGRIN